MGINFYPFITIRDEWGRNGWGQNPPFILHSSLLERDEWAKSNGNCLEVSWKKISPYRFWVFLWKIEMKCFKRVISVNSCDFSMHDVSLSNLMESFVLWYGAPSSSSLSNKHHLVIMVIPGYMQHRTKVSIRLDRETWKNHKNSQIGKLSGQANVGVWLISIWCIYIALYVGQRYSSMTWRSSRTICMLHISQNYHYHQMEVYY